MTPRIPLPSDRVTTLGVADPRLAVPDPAELAPAIAAARERGRITSFALDSIGDPVLIEMVRLRNARFQDCRFCQSTRSAAARQQGASEQLYDSIDDYEHSDLNEEQKAALRFADAYLVQPAQTSQAVQDGARNHFRDDQIVELVLRLMQYSSDKVMVALRLDLDEPRVMTA
jgi:AhpD family alkylhydroperoxidase